ncbi:MAG: hypothetical protein LKF99_04040 [Bifidobacterium sp.]|jgi:hypothetical protein|nr:hypothetical protein [Bifidobacterium sp.]
MFKFGKHPRLQLNGTKEERRANAMAWLRGDYGRAGYTYGVSKLVTGLMVLGGVLYPLTPWGLVICLCVALIAMVGRLLIERQATGDFSDMHEAKRQYESTHRRDYLDFIEARGRQMLDDNKALRPASKAEINELLEWAGKHARRASAAASAASSGAPSSPASSASPERSPRTNRSNRPNRSKKRRGASPRQK